MVVDRRAYTGRIGAARFAEDVGRSLVRQEIEPLYRPETFRADLSAARVGRFDVVRARVPALRARRTPDSSHDDDVFVLRARRGRGDIRIGGTTVGISAERLVMVAAHESFDVVYPTDAELVFLTVPERMLDDRYGALRDHIRHLDVDDFGGRLLASVVDEIAVRPEPGSSTALAQLLDSALAVCVEGRGVEPDDVHRLLRHRALRFIATSDRPAQLSPPRVAEHLHVSLRQLHRCFGGGSSVATAIRERRLRDAARLLTEEPHNTVAAIAARVGFATSSHLATHFRHAYDMSPTEWRMQARS